MYRIIENNKSFTEIIRGNDLVHSFILGIKSMLVDYGNLYSKEEIALLKSYLHAFEDYEKERHRLTPEEQRLRLNMFFALEDILSELVIRCWENDQEYRLISWLKDDQYRDDKTTISAIVTPIDDVTPFCQSSLGLEYTMDTSDYIGASPNDAALIVGPYSPSVYTIGRENGEYLVSYAMATPIITPRQIINNTTKYNETILGGSSYPTRVVYVSDVIYPEAVALGKRLDIPVEYIGKTKNHSQK